MKGIRLQIGNQKNSTMYCIVLYLFYIFAKHSILIVIYFIKNENNHI